MKTANLSLIMLFIATLLFTISPDAIGQRGQGRGQGKGMGQGMGQGQGKGAGYMWQNMPNLSDEQKEKIDVLRLQHQKEMLTVRNHIAEKQARLRTLETEDKADMKAINATIDEIGALKIKGQKSRAAHHQDIRNLLTEEQRVYFDTHKKQRKGMGKQQGKRGGMCRFNN